MLSSLWHLGLYYLDDQSEVESLRHENGDGQGGLLPGLGGQVEHEDWQVEDADAGDDQIHDVEQRLSPDLQVEEYIWEEEEISCQLMFNSRRPFNTNKCSLVFDIFCLVHFPSLLKPFWIGWNINFVLKREFNIENLEH